MPTIGLLWPADTPPVFPRMESFRQGLRASGLVEGQNVALELRYAQRGPQQLPELAAELVRLKVDAIFTGGDLAARVAQQATGTIPIITISDDIIGAGLIASLSRPGGNITGVTILAPELSAKRLEVLRPRPLDESTGSGLAMLSKQVLQFAPVLGNPAAPPATQQFARGLGFNAVIYAPMIRDDKVIGAIGTVRDGAEPFNDKEIALIKAFADQAVIAVENVRLFDEVQARTRELSESL